MVAPGVLIEEIIDLASPVESCPTFWKRGVLQRNTETPWLVGLRALPRAGRNAWDGHYRIPLMTENKFFYEIDFYERSSYMFVRFCLVCGSSRQYP